MSTAVYSQSYPTDTLRPSALTTSNASRSHTQIQAVIQQESQHVEQQPLEEQYNSLFCRALYDYEAQDPSALSFRTDDIIEVLTQQPSGWWDGLLGEERGWFPSNYVTIISDEEAEAAFSQAESTTVDGGNQDIHQVNGAENGSHAPGSNSQSDNEEWLENEMYRHGIQDSHKVTKGNGSQPSDFWIPEVTMDGQVS
jgi:son of sevenless-like protein